ncbi:hypothetical protein CK203_004233 [Vitis vinifera]|uniref:Uncharacterized protein n=1 Tax=Vitis vinifera TaxID=29760 RepID=A0A438KA78_VITVI|nr:hypothetical protein CK203_004233 [Vitis vinifera]
MNLTDDEMPQNVQMKKGDWICPKHRHQKRIHAPATRHFPGRRLHLTRRRVRAREAFSGDAPPPPASSAAGPASLPTWFSIRALHVPLLGIFVSVSPPNSLSDEVPATFSPPQSCTCLGKCSSTFLVVPRRDLRPSPFSVVPRRI